MGSPYERTEALTILEHVMPEPFEHKMELEPILTEHEEALMYQRDGRMPIAILPGGGLIY